MPTIHCVECNNATKMMSVNEVCTFMKRSRRAIYRWIKAQRLHLNRDAGGRYLICKASLLTSCNNNSSRKRALRLL
jgi:excisionase family DNA binding protein